MMKLLIAGSRSYNNYKQFCTIIEKILKKVDKKDLMIIQGDCPKGADAFAKRWAKENNIKCEAYPADWDKHGKKAGMIRNGIMAEKCTHAVLFWDGVSPGTKNMKQRLEDNEVQLIVIRIKT